MRKLLAAGVLVAAGLFASGSALAASPPNMLVIGTNLTGIRTLRSGRRTMPARPRSCCPTSTTTLVQTSADDLQTIKPMLATAWTTSADGKTITLTLRDDAVFQSGNPVTAEDAAWSLQRVIKLRQGRFDRLRALGLHPRECRADWCAPRIRTRW